jgi:hypothetical protein
VYDDCNNSLSVISRADFRYFKDRYFAKLNMTKFGSI